MYKVKHLNYPECSLYDLIKERSKTYLDFCALEYFSHKISYKQLFEEIDRCASALKAIGIRANDAVSICLPNMPQAVIAFYAVNKIGAVANMIHPLSAEKEIAYYLNVSESKLIIAIDLVWDKLKKVLYKTNVKQTVLVSVKDYMPFMLKMGYSLTNRKKIEKPKEVLTWKQLMGYSSKCMEETNRSISGSNHAAILYSGGTTGKPKGILLTNLNFNALALQSIDACGCLKCGDRVLSIMPIFHGFGLGVCIHTVLSVGGTAIILPKFKAMEFYKLLMKYKPNIIAGVPTIYEALIQNNKLHGKDLSFIRCVISGGDSLSVSSKKKLNRFLLEHGCKVSVREGYGLTECVTGSSLMPDDDAKLSSVGRSYADTYYKIVKPGTDEELPYGETGEIILRGPTVMAGYLKEPEETKLTLKLHGDGYTWLHTGDLGYMDEEGYIYFKQRLKRMIVSGGYNIYPQNIENAIDSHECVLMSVAVGIPDQLKGEWVKAYVVLKEGIEASESLKNELYKLCSTQVAKYALPKEIEFVPSLPKTLVGKIAYSELTKGGGHEGYGEKIFAGSSRDF